MKGVVGVRAGLSGGARGGDVRGGHPVATPQRRARPDAQNLKAGALVGFVAATLRGRWWLSAACVDGAGFGLHALALHLGALSVVQPLLVTSVVFALPINHRLRRESVSAPELASPGVLAAALAGFLLIATVGVPATDQPADPAPAVVAGVGAVVIAATLIFAALIKACTGEASSSSPKQQEQRARRQNFRKSEITSHTRTSGEPRETPRSWGY